MPLIIDSAEVAAATILAGLIIAEGQSGDGPAILKRAQTALAVGESVAGLAEGNASAGIAALSAALANSDLDPAVILGLQSLVALGLQQAQIVVQLKGAVPLFGAQATEVLENVSAGIIAAANADIAKYTPAAKPSQAPATA